MQDISYELAKELKEAGFLLIKVDPSREVYMGKKQVYTAFRIDGIDYYAPTLSELIEACPHTLQGRGVFTLSSSNAGALWVAQYVSYLPPITIDGKYHGQGSTPEEAVAHLWLALRKTKPPTEAGGNYRL